MPLYKIKFQLCPFCGGEAELETDRNIFHGQIYSDRYPSEVARQDHGYRVICLVCRCRTCWWHYEEEAQRAWDSRVRR